MSTCRREHRSPKSPQPQAEHSSVQSRVAAEEAGVGVAGAGAGAELGLCQQGGGQTGQEEMSHSLGWWGETVEEVPDGCLQPTPHPIQVECLVTPPAMDEGKLLLVAARTYNMENKMKSKQQHIKSHTSKNPFAVKLKIK